MFDLGFNLGFSTPSAIQRYFTENNSVTQTYGQFTSDVVLDDDFEIEVDFIIPTNAESVLGSTAEVSEVRLDPSTSGKVWVILNGDFNDYSNALTGLSTTALHTMRIVKTGTAVELFINNVSKGTQFTTLTATFNTYARAAVGSRHYNGIAPNLKVWKGGDRTTGTLVVDSPIDDAPEATYFDNKAAVLGGEEWSNPPETASTEWTDNGDGSYTKNSTADGVLGFDFTSSTISAGAYLVSFTVQAGAVRLLRRNTANTVTISVGSFSVGTYSIAVQITSQGLWFGSDGATIGDVVSNVSIKEIPAATPLIQKFNYVADDTKLFDQVADGWATQFWPNLLVYSEQLDNNAWGKIANVVVTPNFEGNADRVQFVGGVPNEQIHQLTVDIAGRTSNKTFTVSAVMKANSGSPVVRLKNTHGGVVDYISSDIVLTSEFVRYSYTVTNGGGVGTGRQIPGIHVGSSLAAADIIVQSIQLEESPAFTVYKTTEAIAGAILEVA